MKRSRILLILPLMLCLLLCILPSTAHAEDLPVAYPEDGYQPIALNEPVTLTLNPGEIVYLSYTGVLTPDMYQDYAILSDSDLKVRNLTQSGHFQYPNFGYEYERKYFHLREFDEFIMIGVRNETREPVTGTIRLMYAVEPDSVTVSYFTGIQGDVYLGYRIGLQATTTPDNCRYETFTWSSSDESVMIVEEPSGFYNNELRYVKAVGTGSCTITATASNGVSGTWEVTVLAPEEVEVGHEFVLELEPGTNRLYTFTPPETGTYILYYHPDTVENGNLKDGYRSPHLDTGSYTIDTVANGTLRYERYQLTGGKTYQLSLQNGGDEPRKFHFLLDDTKDPESIQMDVSVVHVSAGSYDYLYALPTLPYKQAHVAAWVTDTACVAEPTEMVSDNSARIDFHSKGVAQITAFLPNGNSASCLCIVHDADCPMELSDWTIVVPPTQKTEGVEERTCSNCGVAQRRSVEKLPENPFTDVPEHEWYFQSVLWAVEKGITAGTSTTTFSPDQTCTRAQVVTFLWRAAGKPEPTSDENPFTDVKPGDYFYDAVLWAVENGITSGTGGGKFSPDDSCTRAQVVTFLWRTLGKVAPKSGENPFGDVKSDDYFFEPVLWAVENKITAGTGVGEFSPEDPCTRGQVVTFLYRAMKDR